MQYYYILGGVIVLLLIKIILDFIRIGSLQATVSSLKKKVDVLTSEFDSEKDFKYMHEIINFEMNNCIDTEMIMVSEQKQKMLLKDADLNSYVSIVCKASLEKFSDTYKEKLIIKYFGTKEKLVKYITEYTYNTSLKLFAKLNHEKIKKMKKVNDSKNILEENKVLKEGKDI